MLFAKVFPNPVNSQILLSAVELMIGKQKQTEQLGLYESRCSEQRIKKNKREVYLYHFYSIFSLQLCL